MRSTTRGTRRQLTRAAVTTLVLAACACTYRGAAERAAPESYSVSKGWVVLEGVPEVAQATRESCGAAVAAALRSYWGERDVDEKAVMREASFPRDEPIKAGPLRDALRQSGYDAFLVKADLALLTRELLQGRPVIIATVKPYGGKQMLSHYQVVMGIHPQQGVLTMDPADGYRRYPLEGLSREWEPAARLAILAAPRHGASRVADGSTGAMAATVK